MTRYIYKETLETKEIMQSGTTLHEQSTKAILQIRAMRNGSVA